MSATLKKIVNKVKAYPPAYLFLLAFSLNAAARISAPFCDFYISHIFPVVVELYGRITGVFPFSVGEIMLYTVVILIFLLIIGAGACILLRRVPKWYYRYGNSCIWITSIVCVVMTLNCTILYHGSVLPVRYEFAADIDKEYELQEIAAFRNFIVTRANELSAVFDRDENGYIIYEGDMKKQAKLEMGRLSEEFDCLKGYYPNPKAFIASDFFSQQYMMGYYFPFSMEANYNNRMYLVNTPATMCHELSHLKGIIREDEANFLAFLACVNSEDDLFRYSGYLSVLSYVERDFKNALTAEPDIECEILAIERQVLKDNIFLTREAWEEVENKAVLNTELVKEVSNTIVETNLNINGIADGKISYSRVVNLLLLYFDGQSLDSLVADTT